jgi:hypothetical protein
VIEKKGEHYILTDEVTKVTVELRGSEVPKYAGKRVEVTGSMDVGATPVSDASQVVQAKEIRADGKLKGVAAAAATGGIAGAAAAAGAGIAVSTVAIVGGVAAAATVGGLAASDALPGQGTRDPVSR